MKRVSRVRSTLSCLLARPHARRTWPDQKGTSRTPRLDSPTLAAPPAPPPPPVLSLARVSRLLRPLRTAFASFSTALDHSRVVNANTAAQERARKRQPRPRPRLDDPDWSSPASVRRRSSSLAQAHSKHASLLGAHGANTPDSSPFKQAVRRRQGRAHTTYGSRRAAASSSTAASRSAEPPQQLQPRLDPRHTAAELAARLATPQAGLAAPVLQQRALAALRAYANVLEAVSALASGGGAPTLAEVAARTLGWGIEDDLRALAVAASGHSSGSDAEEEGQGAGGVAMDRSASAQELELVAATAQDEWYEGCPPQAVQCAFPSSRLSLFSVLTRPPHEAGCSEITRLPLLSTRSRRPTCPLRCGSAASTSALHTARMPRCVFLPSQYLQLRAHVRTSSAQASRFHTPLLASLLSLPRSPPPPTLLPILRRAPSPSAILHSTLVPLLLSSTFAQRLFFHVSLSLFTPSSTSTSSSASRDAPLAAALLIAQCTVACAMLRSIACLTATAVDDPSSGINPVDPDSARAMQDEVRRRVAMQARGALGCALRAGREGGESVRDVRDALHAVLRASAEEDGPALDAHGEHDELAEGSDGVECGAQDELRALEVVCGLACGLRGEDGDGEGPIGAVFADESGEPDVDADALEDALRRFLPLLLRGPSSSSSSDQAVEQRLLDCAGPASSASCRALLRAMSECSAVSQAARAEAGRRLLGEEGDSSADVDTRPEALREADASQGDETDYDEPVFVARPPGSSRSRRRRPRVVDSPDEDPATLARAGLSTSSSSSPTTAPFRAASSTRSASASTLRARTRSATLKPPPQRARPVYRAAPPLSAAPSTDSDTQLDAPQSDDEDYDVDSAADGVSEPEPEVLVLSPSPSATPPPSRAPPAAQQAKAIALVMDLSGPGTAPRSEADDLDLLHSVKRRRREHEQQRGKSRSSSSEADDGRGGRAVIAQMRKRRRVGRGWHGGRGGRETGKDDSEDELAM